MNETKKVVGINLFIILVYSIIIRSLAGNGSEKGLEIAVDTAVIITVQVFLNIMLWLILSFMRKDKLAKVFLISSGIVLLVGFSSCWVNASI